MATTVRTDVKVYEEQFQGGFVETVQQNVQAFNEASRGALVMNAEALVGHYEQEAFWDEVSNIARRDSSTDSSSTVASTKLTQDEFISVKLDRRNGPYEVNLDAFRKIGEQPAQEFSRVIGVQTAAAMPQEQLNRVIAALEAKLDSVAALEHDATNGTLASGDLVSGLSKAGDSAGEIILWVMHSKVYFDLLGNQVTNAIYRDNGVQVMEGVPATFNRPVLVTDDSGLIETDGVSTGTDAYSTLGLRSGAATLTMSESPIAVMEGPLTGSDNLYIRWQSEYSYNLGLRGCQWDTSNGGINPTNANVATATNWDTAVADNKLLPGVIIKSQ